MIKKAVYILLAVSLLLLSDLLKAQSTLVLIDRPFIGVDSVRYDHDYLYYRYTGKKKFHTIERDKVFALISSDGKEQLLYRLDSTEGNWYPADKMRYYLLGQEDARNGYGSRANIAAATGFLIGAGASISRLYGAIAIAAVPATVGAFKPAFKERLGYKPPAGESVEDYYKEGYGTMAKRMASRRTFWTTLSGYIVGTGAFYFIFR